MPCWSTQSSGTERGEKSIYCSHHLAQFAQGGYSNRYETQGVRLDTVAGGTRIETFQGSKAIIRAMRMFKSACHLP